MENERRARRKAQRSELGEPDLLPLMNICFMLVLALTTLSAFLPLGFISTEAPKLQGGGAAAAGKPDPNVTVLLLKEGMNISLFSEIRNGSREGRAGEPLIPKIAIDGRKQYNFSVLNKKLMDIKASYPEELRVIIAADPDVEYDDVVRTMDAARETPDRKPLFPFVVFSAGVTEK